MQLPPATTAVVVTTPEVSAIRDADRIIGLLEKDGMASIYLLVNKLRPDLVKKGDMMSSEDVSEILGSEIIGCINDDVNVVIATNRGEALVDQNTSTGKSLTHIAEKLTGEKIYMDKDERRFSLLFFRNIFSRGGDKMIFRKLFKRRRSGTIARERLQILLVTDRIGCNPNTTESIKNDIINTISKYIDIDVENCIVEIRQESGPCLMASIPIKEIKC